jgi:hypothetical protein
MASPPILPLLDRLAARPFSFYPAIRYVEHNEWMFRKATWSELMVVNCKSGVEVSIPRRFVEEVSSIDHPVVIVGLTRELEYRAGAVWPCQRRVIEMPVAVGESGAPLGVISRRGSPAPVVGIKLESRQDRRVFKWVGGALAAAILLHLVANVLHVGELGIHTIPLDARDDYYTVVAKLGRPATDRWWNKDAEHYRALGYPARRYTVILEGPDESSASYIGTVDSNWKPLYTVDPRLRQLKRF